MEELPSEIKTYQFEAEAATRHTAGNKVSADVSLKFGIPNRSVEISSSSTPAGLLAIFFLRRNLNFTYRSTETNSELSNPRLRQRPRDRGGRKGLVEVSLRLV
jgi:hypothetical protein